MRWGGESPPATLTTFSLVTGLQGVLGAFPALVVNYVTPGQRAFSDEVELGGIEPRSGGHGTCWLVLSDPHMTSSDGIFAATACCSVLPNSALC